MITTSEQRLRVLRLLYKYKHLNREDLRDLPCTDLITHRVRIAPGTQPHSCKSQKRWPTHTEWWLRKLVQDGLEGGVYELSEPANGRLSQWNARAVMVDKVENPLPTDEPRMTFDYSRVTELLPGAHLELSSKVHDHLSNPQHGCLFSADLKHAYLTIPLHQDDRHYFAFTISGIGQVQPTRMQQGSQSAGFTMTELAYRAFGPIPVPSPEPSLLHSEDPTIPPPLTFYMDDFFGGFRNFEELFAFLHNHFFPRVEWARLLLSFKKLRLFASRIKALGVVHEIGGLVRILEDRIEKIARWPKPTNQSEVRGFLGTVAITRRWIKNFSELARPLSRLTGKVRWRWTDSEDLSFEILKVKCATQTAMHGINLCLPIHIYTDASGFAAGCAVTQVHSTNKAEEPLQKPSAADQRSGKPFTTEQKTGKQTRKPSAEAGIEVPVLYDSITLTPTQQKYPTYKRELLAIVTFCTKYDYLCKHPYQPTVVHTDHKPLTHFLTSDLHEGVYGNWADKLRRLNISIQYIPGHRNKAADGLSRTLFRDPDCLEDPTVTLAKQTLDHEGPKWIWKDGAGGFEAFLKSLDQPGLGEVINQGTLYGVSVFSLEFVAAKSEAEAPTTEMDSWVSSYQRSSWFGDIYNFLTATNPPPPTPALLKKALNYRVVNQILWIFCKNSYMPCVPEAKVLTLLRETHDLDGHWAKAGTCVRLRGTYWPGQSQDVERYIAGCIECAKHGPATRSQLLNPVMVTCPFELWGMDFIGPLPATSTGNTHILNLICYFSRFDMPYATKAANVGDVISCLTVAFLTYRKPRAIYCDRGQHFFNDELRAFLRLEGVAIEFSPSGASKSTGMVEASNRVLEQVLRKQPDPKKPSVGQLQIDLEWDHRLPKTASIVNTHIIHHLGVSSQTIIFGQSQKPSATATLLALPGRNIRSWVQQMEDNVQHTLEVKQYLRYRADLHDTIRQRSNEQKEQEAIRYNKGVKQATHHVGDLVMLHQKNTNKLEPRWRGPFRISGYGGSHGVSFRIQQLNGRMIRGTFHGDHIKTFVPRAGYLSDRSEQYPLQQTIRRPRHQTKLPKHSKLSISAPHHDP